MIDMTQHIRESNLIEGIDDEEADQDSMMAWQRLVKEREITHGVLMQLHSEITLHQQDLYQNERGNYRRIQVYVGAHTPPAAHMIPSLMMDYLQTFKSMDPINAHIRFETIHPFVDGNGRTGRMLLWWHQLCVNGQKPTLFKASEKQLKYYPLFSKDF